MADWFCDDKLMYRDPPKHWFFRGLDILIKVGSWRLSKFVPGEFYD